jgi:hypothetical protein
MVASHEINGTAKAADEFRVLVIGDSSIWGVLLKAEETLPAYLMRRNTARQTASACASVIGYPIQSLMKDVLLQYSMRFNLT